MMVYIGAEVPNPSVGLQKGRHLILKAVCVYIYIYNVKHKGFNIFLKQ